MPKDTSPILSSKSLPYLEYLDKEMSIMGILSTFCVAVIGGGFTILAGAENSDLIDVLKQQEPFIAAGIICLILASFWFYRQRSMLAWYYGQLSLAIPQTMPTPSVGDLSKWADSWFSWRHYWYGFSFLYASVSEFALVWLHHVGLSTSPRKGIQLALPVAVATIWSCFVFLAFSRFPYVNRPFKALLRKPKQGRHADTMEDDE